MSRGKTMKGSPRRLISTLDDEEGALEFNVSGRHDEDAAEDGVSQYYLHTGKQAAAGPIKHPA